MHPKVTGRAETQAVAEGMEAGTTEANKRMKICLLKISKRLHFICI